MAPVTRFAAAIALVIAAPAHADEVARWSPLINEASIKFSVPTAWVERVMRAESGGRKQLGGRPIRSPKGAMGLMQLMPATWAEMRAVLGLGADPDDPRDNILAGAFYLRLMYDQFGYPGCFAAYNAGPGRYRAWLAGTQTLPRETVAYLGAVSGGTPLGLNGRATEATPLFVVQRQAEVPSAGGSPVAAGANLFAVRKVSE